MKTLKIILFIGLFFNLSMMNGQIHPVENEAEQAQTDSLSQKIIGTWVSENGSWNYRNIYKADGTFIQHWDDEPTETYNWKIHTTTTESGLLISELEITNIVNSGDHYNYMVDVGESKLLLVYQNGGHITRTLYFRQ